MKKALIAIVVLTTLTVADAENLTSNGFSYDYVQGIYSGGTYKDTVSGSAVSADITGYNFRISKLVNENIFLEGAYETAKSTSMKINGTSYALGLDGTQTELDLGYRMSLNESSDLNFKIGIAQYKINFSYSGTQLASESKSTYPITVALRSKLSPELEIQTSFRREDSESTYTIGVGYAINKTIALVGGLQPSDKGDTYFVGLRVNY